MEKSIVTVGTFDGLHRGHRQVVATLLAEARRRGLEPVVVTFDRHPLEIVAPERAPQLIMDPDRRDALLREAGCRVERVAFTEEIRSMTAEDWMRRLRDDYGARVILLGYDNVFGSDGRRLSHVEFSRRAERLGLEAIRAPLIDGCSSSAVRQALAEGRVEKTAEILGRPFSYTAPVVHGRQLGRTIGIPTINLELSPRLALPSPGVYAGATEIDGREYRAVVNIGRRPTVSDNDRLGLEAHIIGYDGDLYGRPVSVSFLRRLRDEKKFDTLDALRAAIARDIEEAGARPPNPLKGG